MESGPLPPEPSLVGKHAIQLAPLPAGLARLGLAMQSWRNTVNR
jgi:hypothetical protein